MPPASHLRVVAGRDADAPPPLDAGAAALFLQNLLRPAPAPGSARDEPAVPLRPLPDAPAREAGSAAERGRAGVEAGGGPHLRLRLRPDRGGTPHRSTLPDWKAPRPAREPAAAAAAAAAALLRPAPAPEPEPWRPVDLVAEPPDAGLIARLGPALCLRLEAVPWRRAGATTIVACARPDRLAPRRGQIEQALGGRVHLVRADAQDIRAAVLRLHGATLAALAERAPPDWASCRDFATRARALRRFALLQLLVLACVLAPMTVFAALAGWAVLTMLAASGLKLAALLAATARAPRRRRHEDDLVLMPPAPMVSVIVPLYREGRVASRLVHRLRRLRYPTDRLEICLTVEADDSVTRRALAAADLPDWIRPVVVPAGRLRTKPRALNYALDLCRGDIIGIWDAEDAPAPDQIERIVEAFRAAPRRVAGFQGILDFYNTRDSWLTRCFTIEYAAWFRLVLPGLRRLGLLVPLGGTTVFLRRDALEEVGRWDAHNVTEDADLGVRLARYGYDVELIETVTAEEAASHPLAWIRQRSRWLKGYAVTWLVHMRSPRRLLAELGPWRFLGFQILFLGTLSQFALQPLLWSFWLITFGFWHPVFEVVAPQWRAVIWASFAFAEAVNLTLAVVAIRRCGAGRRFLLAWIPTLQLYHPLATLAIAKGLAEVLHRPFFWDKTEHGLPPRRRNRSAWSPWH